MSLPVSSSSVRGGLYMSDVYNIVILSKTRRFILNCKNRDYNENISVK